MWLRLMVLADFKNLLRSPCNQLHLAETLGKTLSASSPFNLSFNLPWLSSMEVHVLLIWLSKDLGMQFISSRRLWTSVTAELWAVLPCGSCICYRS